MYVKIIITNALPINIKQHNQNHNPNHNTNHNKIMLKIIIQFKIQVIVKSSKQIIITKTIKQLNKNTLIHNIITIIITNNNNKSQ